MDLRLVTAGIDVFRLGQICLRLGSEQIGNSKFMLLQLALLFEGTVIFPMPEDTTEITRTPTNELPKAIG
jgi:hypothetical protein